MTVASSAIDFYADHTMTVIGLLADVLPGDRLKKARPAGARVELRVGQKQWEAATSTRIDTLHFVVEQHSAKGPLGTTGPQDSKLLGRQSLPPLVVTEDDLRRFHRTDKLPLFVERANQDHDEVSSDFIVQ